MKEFRQRIKHVTVSGIELKLCTLCGNLKSLSSFYKDRRNWDSLTHRCKSCILMKSDMKK